MDSRHHQAAQRFRELNGTAQLEQTLEKTVGALSSAEIPHLVTGACAAQEYGCLRFTDNVDLIVPDIDRALAALLSCSSRRLQPKQLSLTRNQASKSACMLAVLFLTRVNAETTMKASFLRKRKMARGVLVLDGNLSSLEPHLRKKNYHVISLAAGVMDAERKTLYLSQRTLVTKRPQEFKFDVPILEYSMIDASNVTVDDATLADIISLAWTKFRLRSEGWFILRLRQNGHHRIEFPELPNSRIGTRSGKSNGAQSNFCPGEARLKGYRIAHRPSE